MFRIIWYIAVPRSGSKSLTVATIIWIRESQCLGGEFANLLLHSFKNIKCFQKLRRMQFDGMATLLFFNPHIWSAKVASLERSSLHYWWQICYTCLAVTVATTEFFKKFHLLSNTANFTFHTTVEKIFSNPVQTQSKNFECAASHYQRKQKWNYLSWLRIFSLLVN